MANETDAREAKFTEEVRNIRDSQDQAIFEKYAERLNREAADVLAYQRIGERSLSSAPRGSGVIGPRIP